MLHMKMLKVSYEVIHPGKWAMAWSVKCLGGCGLWAPVGLPVTPARRCAQHSTLTEVSYGSLAVQGLRNLEVQGKSEEQCLLMQAGRLLNFGMSLAWVLSWRKIALTDTELGQASFVSFMKTYYIMMMYQRALWTLQKWHGGSVLREEPLTFSKMFFWNAPPHHHSHGYLQFWWGNFLEVFPPRVFLTCRIPPSSLPGMKRLSHWEPLSDQTTKIVSLSEDVH